MSKAKLITVESHQLSDGKAEVSRIGRMWFFHRFYADTDLTPVTSHILTKKEAYKLLEDALKADVLELE